MICACPHPAHTTNCPHLPTASQPPRPQGPLCARPVTDGAAEPKQADAYYNFNGNLIKPRFCESATASVQRYVARDLLNDPTASYSNVQHVNQCVVYTTAQERDYEVPATIDLRRSYQCALRDWEVEAQHGRLHGLTLIIESAIQCQVILKLMQDPNGEINTEWDFLGAYNAYCTTVEGVEPPPGLEDTFARIITLCATWY